MIDPSGAVECARIMENNVKDGNIMEGMKVTTIQLGYCCVKAKQYQRTSTTDKTVGYLDESH